MNANEKASRSKYALLFYSLLLRVTPTVVAKSQVVSSRQGPFAAVLGYHRFVRSFVGSVSSSKNFELPPTATTPTSLRPPRPLRW